MANFNWEEIYGTTEKTTPTETPNVPTQPSGRTSSFDWDNIYAEQPTQVTQPSQAQPSIEQPKPEQEMGWWDWITTKTSEAIFGKEKQGLTEKYGDKAQQEAEIQLNTVNTQLTELEKKQKQELVDYIKNEISTEFLSEEDKNRIKNLTPENVDAEVAKGFRQKVATVMPQFGMVSPMIRNANQLALDTEINDKIAAKKAEINLRKDLLIESKNKLEVVTGQKQGDVGFIGTVTDLNKLKEAFTFWETDPYYNEENADKVINALNKYQNGEKLTDTEQALVTRFTAESFDALVEKNYGTLAGEILVNAVPFFVDIAITKGVLSRVFGAAKLPLYEAKVAQGIKKYLPSIAKRVPYLQKGKVLEGSLRELVKFGVIANTGLASSASIDSKTAQYMLPSIDYEQWLKSEGKDDNLLNYVKDGDVKTTAQMKARLANTVEYASEGLGLFVDDAIKAGVKKVITNDELVKKAFIAKWLKNKKINPKDTNSVQNALKEVGMNDLISEVLIEEEGNEYALSLIEGREYKDPFTTPEGRERLLVGILGIGSLKGMAAITDIGINNIRKLKTEGKVGTVSIPFKDASKEELQNISDISDDDGGGASSPMASPETIAAKEGFVTPPETQPMVSPEQPATTPQVTPTTTPETKPTVTPTPKETPAKKTIKQVKTETKPKVTKLKDAEETLKQDVTLYRGGKGTGFSTLVRGKYFGDNEQLAKQFGDISETSTLPKGTKVFNLDLIKENPNQTIVPKEMLVDTKALTKFLLDKGYTVTKNTTSRGGVEYVMLGDKDIDVQNIAKRFKNQTEFLNYLATDKGQKELKDKGIKLGTGEATAAWNLSQGLDYKGKKVEKEAPKKKLGEKKVEKKAEPKPAKKLSDAEKIKQQLLERWERRKTQKWRKKETNAQYDQTPSNIRFVATDKALNDKAKNFGEKYSIKALIGEEKYNRLEEMSNMLRPDLIVLKDGDKLVTGFNKLMFALQEDRPSANKLYRQADNLIWKFDVWVRKNNLDYLLKKDTRYRVKDRQELFKNDKNLMRYTTAFLEIPKIKNSETLTKKELQKELNQSGGAGVTAEEKRIIQNVLNTDFADSERINIEDFQNQVLANILSLDIVESEEHANYGLSYIVPNKGQLNPKTLIFNSPINHGILGHFENTFEKIARNARANIKELEFDPPYQVYTTYGMLQKYYEGLFGHARVYEEPTNPKILVVAENQSDLYQKSLDDLREKYRNQTKFTINQIQGSLSILSDRRNHFETWLEDDANIISDSRKKELEQYVAEIKDLQEFFTSELNKIENMETMFQKDVFDNDDVRSLLSFKDSYIDRQLKEIFSYAKRNGYEKVRIVAPETVAWVQGFAKTVYQNAPQFPPITFDYSFANGKEKNKLSPNDKVTITQKGVTANYTVIGNKVVNDPSYGVIALSNYTTTTIDEALTKGIERLLKENSIIDELDSLKLINKDKITSKFYSVEFYDFIKSFGKYLRHKAELKNFTVDRTENTYNKWLKNNRNLYIKKSNELLESYDPLLKNISNFDDMSKLVKDFNNLRWDTGLNFITYDDIYELFKNVGVKEKDVEQFINTWKDVQLPRREQFWDDEEYDRWVKKQEIENVRNALSDLIIQSIDQYEFYDFDNVYEFKKAVIDDRKDAITSAVKRKEEMSADEKAYDENFLKKNKQDSIKPEIPDYAKKFFTGLFLNELENTEPSESFIKDTKEYYAIKHVEKIQEEIEFFKRQLYGLNTLDDEGNLQKVSKYKKELPYNSFIKKFGEDYKKYLWKNTNDEKLQNIAGIIRLYNPKNYIQRSDYILLDGNVEESWTPLSLKGIKPDTKYLIFNRNFIKDNQALDNKVIIYDKSYMKSAAKNVLGKMTPFSVTLPTDLKTKWFKADSIRTTQDASLFLAQKPSQSYEAPLIGIQVNGDIVYIEYNNYKDNALEYAEKIAKATKLSTEEQIKYFKKIYDDSLKKNPETKEGQEIKVYAVNMLKTIKNIYLDNKAANYFAQNAIRNKNEIPISEWWGDKRNLNYAQEIDDFLKNHVLSKEQIEKEDLQNKSFKQEQVENLSQSITFKKTGEKNKLTKNISLSVNSNKIYKFSGKELIDAFYDITSSMANIVENYHRIQIPKFKKLRISIYFRKMAKGARFKR